MHAAAFIVGPEDGAGAALKQLCNDIGFTAAAHYAGPEQVAAQTRKTRICFFLVSSTVPKSEVSKFVTEIRHHADKNLRFSPLMFLSEDPSPRTINFCINAGFDDILAPPFTAVRLRDRVQGQLVFPQTYYETSTFFGPIRRRAHEDDKAARHRPDPDVALRIFEVRRDLLRGVNIRTTRTSRVQPASAA